jgi:polyhydroxyalkanoate synthesis regulator phasin
MNETNEPSRLEQLQGEAAAKGREIWLAGLGALSTIEEEGTRLYNGLVERGKGFAERSRALEEEGAGLLENLVERGRRVEEEGRGRIQTVAENLSARQHEVADRLEERVAGLVKKALERFDVPTRAEADALKEQVEALERQVDALKANRAGGGMQAAAAGDEAEGAAVRTALEEGEA